MGNEASVAAAKAGKYVQNQRALGKGGLTWNAYNRKAKYNQREKERTAVAAEHTAKLAAEAAEYKKAQEAAAARPQTTAKQKKKANTLLSFKTMNPGLQSTINALIQRDGNTSKNFVLLEFRNEIQGNNTLNDQLKDFNQLILNPNDEEVAVQRQRGGEESDSINRVRIWTGVENKQFPALALQGSNEKEGLFRHFFKENGTDTNSLLMVASASDEYNFWKYKSSINIRMNDRGQFDTIVLLCIISPNNEVTYDLDRSALKTRGTGNDSLYNRLLNAASNSRFRMLAYKTKAESGDLADAAAAPPLSARAAAEEAFLAVVACAVEAVTAWRGRPAASSVMASSITKFRSLGGKLETNLETEGSTKDVYISSVLNILIELTGGRGTFVQREEDRKIRIPGGFDVHYMTTIANTATPMLLSLLKLIEPVNEVELLIVLRNLTSADNININEEKLSETIDILVQKVISTQSKDTLEIVLSILYNMRLIKGSYNTFLRMQSNRAAVEVLQKIKTTPEYNANIKRYADGILGPATKKSTGGSRRIKKRKIESTRRRHKKHGR